jgi:hypothetical protein
MIRVDKDELFVITAGLIDEATGQYVPGQTVTYDVRWGHTDASLTPTVAGTMTESSVQLGVHRVRLSLPNDGEFICYTTASGFTAGTEEIIVNPESIYDLAKQNRSYNVFVEDVIKTNVSGNYGQNIRKVPYGKTDYIINNIKRDDVGDWDDPTTVSGRIYAWYRSTSDSLPYRMGPEF